MSTKWGRVDLLSANVAKTLGGLVTTSLNLENDHINYYFIESNYNITSNADTLKDRNIQYKAVEHPRKICTPYVLLC